MDHLLGVGEGHGVVGPGIAGQLPGPPRAENLVRRLRVLRIAPMHERRRSHALDREPARKPAVELVELAADLLLHLDAQTSRSAGEPVAQDRVVHAGEELPHVAL